MNFFVFFGSLVLSAFLAVQAAAALDAPNLQDDEMTAGLPASPLSDPGTGNGKTDNESQPKHFFIVSMTIAGAVWHVASLVIQGSHQQCPAIFPPGYVRHHNFRI